MRSYVRDKRSPKPKSETVSRVMSANRARDTKPEMALRRALWANGIRGYRLHRTIKLDQKTGPPVASSNTGKSFLPEPSRLQTHRDESGPPAAAGGHLKIPNPKSQIQNRPVRPDITFVSKRLAIFVHGCFWHRCPRCSTSLPKHNTPFWQAKFERNIERDARKTADLQAAAWQVLTVWECDLKRSPGRVPSDALSPSDHGCFAERKS